MDKKSQASYRAFAKRKNQLLEAIKNQNGQIRIKKKTSSNLFRYSNSDDNKKRKLSLKSFNHILHLDKANLTLELEGLTTYESIVNYTFSYNLLPTIAPELKHITIGGAIVGIGIESTGFKYGFVHDGLLEAEVLLPNGEIVVCNPHNSHADLFYALPNSYGTLGYILRAKIKLYPAKPYVQLTTTRFGNTKEYVKALEQAALSPLNDFVEGLFYSSDELYLTTGQFVDAAGKIADIYRSNIYYKQLRQQSSLYLKTIDYIFRFDPDWFWNIPETPIYNLFRKFCPKAMRNSGFYKKFLQFKRVLMKYLPSKNLATTEPLIQDWEVPWEHAQELIDFALQHVNLKNLPWAALPIKALSSPTLYPLKTDQMYFNLGCYCFIDKTREQEDFHATKILDQKCFALSGIKMLYSSTFIDQNEFDQVYNGKNYQLIKDKYDPKRILSTLYDKVAAT